MWFIKKYWAVSIFWESHKRLFKVILRINQIIFEYMIFSLSVHKIIRKKLSFFLYLLNYTLWFVLFFRSTNFSSKYLILSLDSDSDIYSESDAMAINRSNDKYLIQWEYIFLSMYFLIDSCIKLYREQPGKYFLWKWIIT